MRILFMHHFPLAESAVGELVRQWALAIVAAGHEARLLLVDTRKGSDEPIATDCVVCRDGEPDADLPFDAPRFSAPAATSPGPEFHQLPHEQLTRYREQLRRHLDAQVDQFDPHVIHGQHIWVQGQLAVETGVPYLLNAWGPELVDYDLDARYQALADQAATNAGRVLVPDDATSDHVQKKFEVEPSQLLLMPRQLWQPDSSDLPAWQASAARELVALYQAVLDERFGKAS